jgi:hypothetical protein
METFLTMSQVGIGLIGVLIAALLYQLNKQNRIDSWYRTLRDFHSFFWNDASCARVRSWLACDAAYDQVRATLAKRNADTPLTVDEYAALEEIDRFAALLMAYKGLAPDFPRHQETYYRLFEDYWLGCLTEERRPELRKYIKRFFPELCENLPIE